MNSFEIKKDTPQLTPWKRFMFSALLVLFSLMASLAVGEYFLRYRSQRIEQSNHFDPGHIVYDRLLGWKLAPNWSGRHRHHDFDVGYSTNRYGFRGEFPEIKSDGVKRYAIVGDSFTFSYGVNDDETFIHLLNRGGSGKRQFLNFGVPGYSTDQELLLIKDRVLLFLPDVAVLVVYLGNDLFDNQLSFPLQADRAKPLFRREGERIVLENAPVPVTTKPTGEHEAAMRKVGLDGANQGRGWLEKLSDRFMLARLLAGHFRQSAQGNEVDFKNRFREALYLFYMIADQIVEICRSNNVELQIVLMPGQSFVTSPGTLSAPVQAFFRQEILSNQARWGVPILDLAGHLRKTYERSGEALFYTNEGHLNQRGHRVVADFLAENL